MHFHKYHGTGNDFILIDDRLSKIGSLNKKQIRFLCDRRFGIGADGLMILKKHETLHFTMDYYNSDGSGATMCGNGGRCIASFARKLGLCSEKAVFEASDGVHEAVFLDSGEIMLKMGDVQNVETSGADFFCRTGSPHHVIFTENIDAMDIYGIGKNIRNSEKYAPEGTNVNFVEIENQRLYVRTYERGVEDETLSCGTGVTASALAYAHVNNMSSGSIRIKTRGGELSVSFVKSEKGYKNIRLSGPATFVFEGNIDLR